MRFREFLKYILNRIFKILVNSINTIRFLFNRIKKDTVLLVEANNSHTELFPSFVKYLKDLKYNVEIVANTEQIRFLPKLDANRIFFFNIPGIGTILKFKKIEKYSAVILTSYRLYYPTPDKKHPHSTVFDYFNIKHNEKIACVYHHLEDYKKENKGCSIVLSKILKKNDFLYIINPCHFKENSPKNKNKKTTFVVVGKLEMVRKNANLLIDSTNELLDKGIKDFKINLIGDNADIYIPDNLKDFIDIKGKLTFEKLYKELEKADFYLPLLDPEEHKRYLTMGTSGSFQLIRGFLLPPAIHKTFADAYSFNNKNSVIYDDNKGFSLALQECINMNNEDFLNIQTNLFNDRKEIYKNSTQGLKTLLDSLILR